jgi:hypothetical protein
MKELFRNDAPWEKNLVEGPFVQKRGEYFYCFYLQVEVCVSLGSVVMLSRTHRNIACNETRRTILKRTSHGPIRGYVDSGGRVYVFVGRLFDPTILHPQYLQDER